jgi:hypothetical protein
MMRVIIWIFILAMVAFFWYAGGDQIMMGLIDRIVYQYVTPGAL